MMQLYCMQRYRTWEGSISHGDTGVTKSEVDEMVLATMTGAVSDVVGSAPQRPLSRVVRLADNAFEVRAER